MTDEPIRDLRPEFKKKRKEPPKPWGKKERYVVLVILLATVFTAGILAASARDFKLPGFPKFNFDFKNPFAEQVIVVGKRKDKSEKIIQEFESKTKNLSGTYALYVIDLSSGDSFGIDQEKIMQAASLIKLPVMLYAAQANNAQGKVDDKKIEAMGRRSDNNIFIEIRKKFGDDVLQEYIKSVGMANTSLIENETIPKEIGEFFRKYKDESFMNFLVDTIYEDWLAKGVPMGTKVVHKYGRELHVVNDAGIVYGPKPYVVVIMTQGVVEKEADDVFPELSRLVYDGMNNI